MFAILEKMLVSFNGFEILETAERICFSRDQGKTSRLKFTGTSETYGCWVLNLRSQGCSNLIRGLNQKDTAFSTTKSSLLAQ